MYLPRSLLSKLYLHLQQTRHPLSPPVLILVALEPDALCACRILTCLLKHDYIPHKIQPVAGYADLERLGSELVAPMMESRGGAGGVVVCLGVGGMIDLGASLGLESNDDSAVFGGVEVWVVDSHRPWNLNNVFGGFPLEADAGEPGYESRRPPGVTGGRVDRGYRPGKGGVIVFDDGDIEDELGGERTAYLALDSMPDVEDNGEDVDGSDSESDDEDVPQPSRVGQKRKSWGDESDDQDDEDDEDDRPRQRRRSNSVSVPSAAGCVSRANPPPVVEPHPRLSQTATGQRAPFSPRPDPIFVQRSRRPSLGRPAAQGALGPHITQATPQAQEGKRVRLAEILQDGLVLLGAHLVHDLLAGIGTGSRRQRSFMVDHRRGYLYGAIRPFVGRCRRLRPQFRGTSDDGMDGTARRTNTATPPR